MFSFKKFLSILLQKIGECAVYCMQCCAIYYSKNSQLCYLSHNLLGLQYHPSRYVYYFRFLCTVSECANQISLGDFATSQSIWRQEKLRALQSAMLIRVYLAFTCSSVMYGAQCVLFQGTRKLQSVDWSSKTKQHESSSKNRN